MNKWINNKILNIIINDKNNQMIKNNKIINHMKY